MLIYTLEQIKLKKGGEEKVDDIQNQNPTPVVPTADDQATPVAGDQAPAEENAGEVAPEAPADEQPAA